MDVVISSGHGKHVRGASCFLDEVDEARRVVEAVAELLREAGVGVETFHDDTSTSQNENLNTIVDFHNSQDRDLDVSVHFNAYQETGKPMGCECLYVTQDGLAERVSEAIAKAGDLIDRGPKHRGDLFFLNSTDEPSILIEVCFVDSSADADLYRTEFDGICQAIAGVIAGEFVESKPPPPPEEVEEEKGNVVDIAASVEGDVTILVNGQLVRGELPCTNKVVLQVTLHGEVTVSINGQDFHNEPTIPWNQRDITASVFGGEGDYNVSAYDENMVLNDQDYYVALPDRFEGGRPGVRVHNRRTGLSQWAEIWDVGPWNIDDPYWKKGTRPLAETCHNEGEPLPDGPNAGKTPSNPAGIDLSPALAAAIGIGGLGPVDFEFETDD
jgi:N-acetylmuramoyl-L-alanine amidase